MSYANMVMYGAVLPSYKKGSDKDTKHGNRLTRQKHIKVDDPTNRDKVNKIMKQFD